MATHPVVETSARLEAPPPVAPSERSYPLRMRGLVIGFALLPFTTYWAVEIVLSVIFSLLIPPVAALMAVALLNAIGRKVFGRWYLETPDLVVIFTILFVGTAMASEWMNVVAPLWHSFGLYADQNETYRTRVIPHLADWLFFRTAEPIREYGIGGYPFPYALTKLGVWLPIFLGWLGLFGSAAMAMLCINTLMRRLWTQQERLAFPIIQVPMLLCQPQSPLWRSRYLWGAFIVMVLIDTINALNMFFPWIPPIKTRFLAHLNDYLHSPPWNQTGWIPVGLFPYMSAIGVFVPNDLLFSSVLFYFVRKLMQVATAALGYEQGVFGGGYLVPQPPYFSEQSWGAFLGLFVSVVWASRGYLKEIWHEIRTGYNPEAGYAISARWAFIGLILSLGVLIGLGVAVGLPWWLVTIYVLLYMAFSVVVARLRAQLGAPIHEMAFMGPHQLMIAFTGTQNLTESTIARLMTTFHFMNRLHRSHPMPYELESMKMGELARLNQKALWFVIASAVILGILLGEFFSINRFYRDGARDFGQGMAGVITQLADNRYPPNVTAMAFFTGAFCFVLLLDFIRYRVPGFPIHPAGYALSMNFGIDYIWFGLGVVLLIKLFVNRYYGLQGYEKLRAVAIGVILGEFAVDFPLAVYHLITGQAVYTISINGHLGWNQ
ncbi:MAG: hypothetical protein K6U12_13590 [Armatimonadetes bacterium]|nr:hypothetical protein [Armatimonadota bacterium]